MDISGFNQKGSVGQVLARLRHKHRLYKNELNAVLQTTGSTYLKIERDERELSFIMAVKLCQFYDMDLNDLVAMIDESELERRDLTALRMEAQRKKKKNMNDSSVRKL